MNIKQPFVWSTSGYNSPDVKINESAIPVAAAICRASIGTPTWFGGGSDGVRKAKDQVFPIYWQQWDIQRIARGAYDFLINKDKAANQAKFFVQCLIDAGGWQSGDKIILDLEEEEGASLRAALDWFNQVNTLMPELVPAHDFLLYSRANILNKLSIAKLTAAEKHYLLSISGWSAGYPDNPDSQTFEQLLEAYHYDTSKYGPTVGIQYAAAAVVDGLSKKGYLSIECNVFDPAYLKAWQDETAARYEGLPPVIPPVEPPVEPPVVIIGQKTIKSVTIEYTDGSQEIRPA